MSRPPLGFCFRVTLEEIRDGDTVEVRVKDGHVWAVRVLDLWCPEKHTEYGKLATRACQSFLGRGELFWHIDPPKDTVNIAKMLSFDRIPSTIWIGDEKLRDLMIAGGFGFANKQAQQEAEAKFAHSADYRGQVLRTLEAIENE